MTFFRSPRLWLGITALIGALVLCVPIAFVAWFFGLLMPLQAAAAERDTATLERRLIVGASRADIERQFGHQIPQPFRRDSGADTPVVARSYTRASEYSYVSGSEMCFARYLGVTVYYDAHDRVKAWKRFTWADGC